MTGLIVNSSQCSGCRICELICSFWHEGSFNPSRARIRVVINRAINTETTSDQIDVPIVCRQCEPAPCAEICPEEAITQNENFKSWQIDDDRCNGCGLCVETCPYDMIVIDDTNHVARKCDLCQGIPQCVQFCPREALTTKT